MENITLLDKLVTKLESNIRQKLINKYKNMRTVFLRISPDDINDAVKYIEEILEEYKGRSEIIKLLINEGYFMDTGIETLKIEYGLIWEIYDYPTFTHYLIRLLKIIGKSNNRNWIAIYIDENPDTAWWTEEERRVF